MATYLIENEQMDQVEFSERCEGFKIKLGLRKIPKDISLAVRKSCREMVTLFGETKLRVRFLPSSLLEAAQIDKMKALLETLDLWTKEYLCEREENMLDYGDLFYGYANDDAVLLNTSGIIQFSTRSVSEPGITCFNFLSVCCIYFLIMYHK